MIISGSVAPWAASDVPTALAAEPGQTPAPTDVAPPDPVPENCKGIAPTPGSAQDTTGMELNEGQGSITVGPNALVPGGVVHWLVTYAATDTGKSFEIRDCVVAFNADNPAVATVLGLVGAHGQLIPTPGC
jgi:hypothetical protein